MIGPIARSWPAVVLAIGLLTIIGCGKFFSSSAPAVSPPSPDYTLRILNERQLTATPGISEYPNSWSPDGKYLAATIFAGKVTSFGPQDGIYIEIINASNGQRRRLLPSSSARDFFPMWSPDGTRIAFFSNRSGNLDVWAVNNDGTNLTQLTTDPAEDLYGVWSPDGSNLAFLSTRSKEVAIWMMDSDGVNQRQITAGGNGDWGASWRSDGRFIAFGSTRFSALNQPKEALPEELHLSFERILVGGIPSRAIWTIDLQTLILKRLTDENGSVFHYNPVWSPDGMKIAYISNEAGTEDIWIMDYDGGHRTRLTSSDRFEVFPVWSPDGSQLVYAASSGRADYTDIRIVTLKKEQRK
jgi:Tol biopolymer transport system component